MKAVGGTTLGKDRLDVKQMPAIKYPVKDKFAMRLYIHIP